MLRCHLRWPGLVAGLLTTISAAAQEPGRPRARDLGLAPGVFSPGPQNAITDVRGVRVGQVTLVEGDRIRTGVTAVVPHPGNVFQDKVAAGVFIGNAFGKLAGSTQVQELGTLETPIVLTNTLAVGAAVEGVVAEVLSWPGNEQIRSVNAVVGETNDGGLNDIRALRVRPADVREAVRGAAEGPVAEGSIGAGTGTQAFGWKGGIGTSSRVLASRYGGYALGVLVQSNFGGVLTMDGVPVGRELGRYAYGPPENAGGPGGAASPQTQERGGIHFRREETLVLGGVPDTTGGSCMIVVATDAPLTARDLERLAARAVFGLARTGSSYSHGSGDYAIAFSTAPEVRTRHGRTEVQARAVLPSDAVSPLFQAVLEATEEAVLNSLLRATTVTGNGRTVEAIPVDGVRDALRRHGRRVFDSVQPRP